MRPGQPAGGSASQTWRQPSDRCSHPFLYFWVSLYFLIRTHFPKMPTLPHKYPKARWGENTKIGIAAQFQPTPVSGRTVWGQRSRRARPRHRGA